MGFKEPFKIYTAASNVEAHQIVDMLLVSDIEAYADEDQSGVSLWALGRISQFHQPNVWIEKSAAEQAAEVIRRFEENKRQRDSADVDGREIEVQCEGCETILTFPATLDGTTQECSRCGAFVDVGELDWDEDFGQAEE